MSDFEREVKFLIDRLRQFENENMDEESFRDWNGHVAPSIARLETMMESQGGELEPVAHVFPDALDRLESSECVVDAYSVEMGHPVLGKTVPLFKRRPPAGAQGMQGKQHEAFEIACAFSCHSRAELSEAGVTAELHDLWFQKLKAALLAPAPTQGVPEGWVRCPTELWKEIEAFRDGDSSDHYNVLRDLVNANQPPKDNTQEGES